MLYLTIFNSNPFRFVLQTLAITGAATLCVWGGMPVAAFALALLGVCALAANLRITEQRSNAQKWFLRLAWLATIAAPFTILLQPHQQFTWDYFHAVIAWLNATVCLANGLNPRIRNRTLWKKLAMTWALAGAAAWLVAAYSQNHWAAFHFGVLVSLILLIACKLAFSLAPWMIQTRNTLIVLMVGLPVFDFLAGPNYDFRQKPALGQKLYSYEQAKKNPRAYDSWWSYYVNEMHSLTDEMYMTDPAGILPYRLRPHSKYNLFGLQIKINSRGFRGEEIQLDKGTAYRIVALGESTTFGINEGVPPWPERLEEMLAEKFHAWRPVEVINTGIPSCTLPHTIHRLQKEILPLNPDMIVCYHGYNGFSLLSPNLPSIYGPRPPGYRPRPLKLLALGEYRMKVLLYKRRVTPAPPKIELPPIDLMKNEYAQAYRQLIEFAQTNNIQLVLANFSLAVNARSDSEVIDFYRRGAPSVQKLIKINELHAKMVEQLAGEYRGVHFTDTHPNLDGYHQKFTDVVHFNEEGEQQLAKIFFARISELIERSEKRLETSGR